MPSRYFIRFKDAWSWLTLYGPFKTDLEAVAYAKKDRPNRPENDVLALFHGRRIVRELSNAELGAEDEMITKIAVGEHVQVINKRIRARSEFYGVAGAGIVYEQDALPSCGGASSGSWYCATHEEIFGNNLEKDCHTAHGAHKLVWVCHEHGPEVP